MSSDLEDVLEFDRIKSQSNLLGLADYGVNASSSINHISIIARTCEELFYKKFKEYLPAFA